MQVIQTDLSHFKESVYDTPKDSNSSFLKKRGEKNQREGGLKGTSCPIPEMFPISLGDVRASGAAAKIPSVLCQLCRP